MKNLCFSKQNHMFLRKTYVFSKPNHSFSMPDSVLLCVLKRPFIGIHLGTIGQSREEKEEKEKRDNQAL